jgi:hypothetical protein
MVLIRLHPLNLNHETRQLEEVILVKHLVFLDYTFARGAREYLIKNLFDQGVVAVVEQVNEISFQDFDKFSVVQVKGFLVDYRFGSLNHIVFSFFTHKGVRLLPLALSKVRDVN